jgi:amidohydrolase
MELKTLINEKNIIKWRQHLHKNPELSQQEVKTAQFICDILETFGCFEIERPTTTSVVAILKTGKPGKTIALRADTDALPVLEETDVEFASEISGVMHACGHDAHTAMLLGACETVAKIKDKFVGTVKFVFQHAEELPPGGAKEIMATGILADVDEIYGIHIDAMTPTGVVKLCRGAMTASGDAFEVRIQGKGSHGSTPYLSIDPIIIGSELVLNLSHLVSHGVNAFDNAVITVGEFTSGNAANVIPDSAFIQGTVRATNSETRLAIKTKIESMVEHITAMYGATYDLNYILGYSAVINTASCVDTIEKAAQKVVPVDKIDFCTTEMGGEDFSAYLEKIPGAFFKVGAQKENDDTYGYAHHHPKFKIDENAFIVGTQMHVQLLWDLLGEK